MSLFELKHHKHRIKLQLWVIYYNEATVYYLLLSLLDVDVIAADAIALFIDE
jgi:hypothetical protein